MTRCQRSLAAILLPALCAAWPAAAESFLVLDSERQSGSAVAYNANADEYLVVGVRRDWFAGRVVGRRADGGVSIGPTRRFFDVGAEPAVAFGAGPDMYLAAAIHGSGFGVLAAGDGSRLSETFGVDEPNRGATLLRAFYSPPRRRWIVLRRVGDYRLQGASVAADGSVKQMRPRDLPVVEFGDLDVLDVAPTFDHEGFLLVWIRAGEIWGQLVDLADGPSGPRLRLAAGRRNRGVSVARAGDSERFFVVWEESQRIWGRTLEGEKLGRVVELGDRPAEAFVPVVTFNRPAGRFLLVWTEQVIDRDLRGRWLDERGRPLAPSFAIASGPGHQLNFDHNSVACSERSRECLVTWNEGAPGAPASNVHGRFVEAP